MRREGDCSSVAGRWTTLKLLLQFAQHLCSLPLITNPPGDATGFIRILLGKLSHTCGDYLIRLWTGVETVEGVPDTGRVIVVCGRLSQSAKRVGSALGIRNLHRCVDLGGPLGVRPARTKAARE